MKDRENLSVPVIGISRFRIGTDREGLTTPVAFQGCTLRCKYCINPDCWRPEKDFRHYTPQELYDELKKDDLYLRATGGGVTFGGGEPALRADFIAEFRKLCGSAWKIRIETSLNCKTNYINTLAPVIDEWIIDTKAERSVAYHRYTGGVRHCFRDNVWQLVSRERLNVAEEKLTFKVPIIPGYVDETAAIGSVSYFKRLFPKSNVELVTYLDNEQLQQHRENARTVKGKELCDLLSVVRWDLAERYGIQLPKRKCSHKGDCRGTCPLCDYDLETLSLKLATRNIDRPEVTKRLRDLINNSHRLVYFLNPDLELVHPGEIPYEGDEQNYNQFEYRKLQGDIAPPYDSLELEGQVVELPPHKEINKIVFKECALAGVSFQLKYDDELWHELDEGVELALVRHKNNKYDPNAVAVALAGDYDGDPDNFDFNFILGYVPRKDNSELAAMLDAGYGDKLSAKITTFSNHGYINNRIRITIYLETSKPVFVSPDLLRVQKIDSDELRYVLDSLQNEGTCYMRFLRLIPPGSQYKPPMVEDKIVMVYEHPNNYSILLMRIIAENEDCRQFTSKDIDADDDCAPYILTNILGPIDVPKFRNGFIQNVLKDYFNPSNYLPAEISHLFEILFKDYLANHIYKII